MHKKHVFILLLLLSTTFFLSTFSSVNKVRKTAFNLKYFSDELLTEYKELDKMIDNLEFEISDNNITIYTETTAPFTNLDEKKQFGYYFYFTKHIRHYIRYKLDDSSYKNAEISLISKMNQKYYKFVNKPEKNCNILTESILYINNKKNIALENLR